MALAIRLNPLHFHELATHFLALPATDRQLRFGRSTDDAALIAYVNAIDLARDSVFAVHDPELDIAGAVHIAFTDDTAELGLSVLPGARGRGIGRTLLERARLHAQSRGVRVLYTHCLATNEAMKRLARQAGMRVITAEGESEAHAALPPSHGGVLLADWLEDRMALADYTLRVQAQAQRQWLRQLNAA
jgi:RimJ/RimL family protein N-acetyltransferase